MFYARFYIKLNYPGHHCSLVNFTVLTSYQPCCRQKRASTTYGQGPLFGQFGSPLNKKRVGTKLPQGRKYDRNASDEFPINQLFFVTTITNIMCCYILMQYRIS